MGDPVLRPISILAGQPGTHPCDAMRTEDECSRKSWRKRLVGFDQCRVDPVPRSIERSDEVTQTDVLTRVAIEVVMKPDEVLAPIDVRVVEPCDPPSPAADDLVEVRKVVRPDGEEPDQLPGDEERDQRLRGALHRRQACADSADEDVEKGKA